MGLQRASTDWLGVDRSDESTYSDIAALTADTVMVERVADRNGNAILKIHNVSGTTIDPNGSTTYDQADIGSSFTDGPGGKFYVKSDATTWTEVT